MNAVIPRATVLAISIVLLSAGPAGADRAAAGHGANTFSGSCQLTGTVSFDPPLTNTAQAITQHAQAAGTCSGTFTASSGQAHQMNNAPVSYRATEYAAQASCNAETDSGSGTITFAYGTTGFTISETRLSGAAAVMLKGDAGGSAAGEANVSPSASPVAIAQACAGSGLAEAPIQAQAHTTPSISG